MKKLKNGGEWKKSNRPANTLYADDDINELKGIGPVKNMLKDLGIKTISHLLAFQSEIKCLGKKKHDSLLEQARSALPINIPKDLYVD